MKAELIFRALGLAASCALLYFSTHCTVIVSLAVASWVFLLLFLLGVLETLCEITPLGDMLERFLNRED